MDDINLAATAVPDFNVFGWPATGLVTLFTLALYQYFALSVGAARRKFKVPPPEMNGPPEFQRVLRVQTNTLEQLIIFLPLLWIAALSSRDEVAAGIGVLWPVGRFFYSIGYRRDPRQRLPGFIMSNAVLAVLFCLAVVQLVRSVIAWQ